MWVIRAYLLSDDIRVLTKDQTLVEREVELGNITREQAEVDPRRSVLLQCVGASENVIPDMFYGDVMPNTAFYSVRMVSGMKSHRRKYTQILIRI